jgi:hypothetical protein
MASRSSQFDPVAILAALERSHLDYVLIGGLAQVLRGADVITAGVDISPSFARGNLEQLNDAVEELGGRVRRQKRLERLEVTEQALSAQPILRISTSAGELGVVASPVGIPNGYVDLRRAASHEDLGGGLRPLVASTGDLAAMAAALHRKPDLERLSMLRRIVELEANRGESRQGPPVPSTVIRPRAKRAGRRIDR